MAPIRRDKNAYQDVNLPYGRSRIKILAAGWLVSSDSLAPSEL